VGCKSLRLNIMPVNYWESIICADFDLYLAGNCFGYNNLRRYDLEN